MILLGALLQIAAPSPSTTDTGVSNTITEAEARATPAVALARRVLGMAGADMVEATVGGSWREPFGGSIDFAARPTASGWDGLCSVRTFYAVLVSESGSGEANLPHRVIGLKPGHRYRLLDSPDDRTCTADGPALATTERPGFFQLHCDGKRCDDPRTALLAADVMRAAGRRLTEKGFARCRSSQAMGAYCPTATRRVSTAFATGFPILSIQPCQANPTQACVTADVPPSEPSAQLHVEVATTLPMDPAALLPSRSGVTGVEIVISPPVVID